MSLYGGWLTRYQHVERMGHADVVGLLEGEVYVQEKLDGANLSVAWDPQEGLIIASRNNVISIGGKVYNSFNGACDYVNGHLGIGELLSTNINWVLRGEWLVRHSINYSKDKLNRFYVFDIQQLIHDHTTGEEVTERYINPSIYTALLDKYKIDYIPTLASFTNPTMDDIVKLVKGSGGYGAEQMEGVVIKNSKFVNKWGRVTWGKVVCDDFKIKNKATFGANRFDEVEVKFSSKCTREFVLKEIYKLRDEVGKENFTIKLMGRVLEQVWRELFKEEMFEFSKGCKSGFNFEIARKNVYVVAREVALAYFNGLIVDEGGYVL